MKFDLCLKALKKFLEDSLCDFFENLVVDCSLVLHGLLLVVGDTNCQESHTLLREICDGRRTGLGVEIVDLLLHQLHGLVFYLVAPVLSHHLALVREVQFLLVLDDRPGGVNKVAESINGHSLGSIGSIGGDLWVEAILGPNREPLLEDLALVSELCLAVNFVREQHELNGEEFLSSRVLELIWLVDVRPKLVDVLVDQGFDGIRVLATGVVSDHKEQALSSRLPE